MSCLFVLRLQNIPSASRLRVNRQQYCLTFQESCLSWSLFFPCHWVLIVQLYLLFWTECQELEISFQVFFFSLSGCLVICERFIYRRRWREEKNKKRRVMLHKTSICQEQTFNFAVLFFVCPDLLWWFVRKECLHQYRQERHLMKDMTGEGHSWHPLEWRIDLMMTRLILRCRNRIKDVCDVWLLSIIIRKLECRWSKKRESFFNSCCYLISGLWSTSSSLSIRAPWLRFDEKEPSSCLLYLVVHYL